MIQERYVSFEIAKLLKEKGMDKNCFTHYIQQNNEDGTSEAVATCTLYMAMEWLREKNIYIYIQPTKYVGGALYGFQAVVEDGRNSVWKKSIHHAEGHEEAVEAAIEYCLENLI